MANDEPPIESEAVEIVTAAPNQLCQEAPGAVELAQEAAEEGVDESGLGAEAGFLGQLNGFVDSGMVGDAVEPENLVKPEAQEVLEHRVLGAPVGFPRDEPVEGGLPADDAVNKLLAEVPVGSRKARLGQRGLEDVFDKIPARAPVQDTDCNFSGFLDAHNV